MSLLAPAARPRILPCLAALLVLAPALDAQTVRAVEVATDNDAYTFWTPNSRPDEEYTHGIWVAVDVDAAPGWRRLAGARKPCRADAAMGEACLSTRFVLGQKLFTPRVDAPVPVPGERPYAGWLFASATARVSAPRRRRELGVELGVTGEPSLGQAVHTLFHRVAGFRDPEGWRHQRRFEPGVVLRYNERRLVAERRVGGVRVAELVPEWGAAAGTCGRART